VCSFVRFAAILCFAFLSAASIQARAETKHVAPDFTLSDQHGRPFTLSREHGHPVVLFFGYTHCPDVCPTILANLKSARAALGPKGSDIVVALITVDAARDTKAELGEFVSAFDPSFLGLTGTGAQLKSVYRDYHVRYVKQAEGPGGYLVSHTAFVYYIGRDGRVHGFGTWSDPQDILREDLKRISVRRTSSSRSGDA
jgi:protein SCO1/2